MNSGGVSGTGVLSGGVDIVWKNLKDLNCNNGTGKNRNFTNSGDHRKTNLFTTLTTMLRINNFRLNTKY